MQTDNQNDENLGLPQEVLDDLNIINGFTSETQNPFQDPRTAQEKFLEERAKKNAMIEYKVIDPKIIVLDLAQPDGRAEYESIISKIVPLVASDPQWRFNEESSPLVLDPNSSVGYRLIVVIKYWKQVIDTDKSAEHGFEFIKK